MVPADNVGPGATDEAFVRFVGDCRAALDRALNVEQEQERPDGIATAMHRLLASGWQMGDARYCAHQPGRQYGSYLLYRSADPAFVVILDSFAAGQRTDIHDHGTWAVVGVVAGAEEDEIFRRSGAGDAPTACGSRRCPAGTVTVHADDALHRLCTEPGTDSVSLHVYGADVGDRQRNAWNGSAGRWVRFRSGYANAEMGVPVYLAHAEADLADLPR